MIQLWPLEMGKKEKCYKYRHCAGIYWLSPGMQVKGTDVQSLLYCQNAARGVAPSALSLLQEGMGRGRIGAGHKPHSAPGPTRCLLAILDTSTVFPGALLDQVLLLGSGGWGPALQGAILGSVVSAGFGRDVEPLSSWTGKEPKVSPTQTETWDVVWK